jgi:streptogramin lyase
VSGFWDFNPLLSYYPNNTGGSGGYAYSNYWDWSELRSPNLDLSSMTAPFLEFKTDYYGSGGSGQAYVDVNVNGGESWITAWSSGTTDYPGPHTIQVDLSAIAAGKPAVVIRFMYSNGDSGSYWAIDDVKVYNNVDVTPPAIGMDITQTYKAQWGSDGSGDGQLSGPRGIAVDGSGNVYVADWGNNRIQKFNASGAYLTQWGGSGTGDGQFDRPYGVAVDSSGNVYATDIYNNRIQKFSSSGTYLTQWNSDGQLNGPRGIAVDASGNVYVADLNNNRIQKFNSNGAYLTQWGASGSGDGQFDSPTNLAVDVYGNVYVSNCGMRLGWLSTAKAIYTSRIRTTIGSRNSVLTARI